MIGYNYGFVGGNYQFRLPDLRGRVIRGAGSQNGFTNPQAANGPFSISSTLSVYGGAERIALTTGQMPRHRHDFLPLSTGRRGNDDSPAKGLFTNSFSSNPNPYGAGGHVMNWAGNDEPHDNMQPYYNINYLIKYL